MPPLDHSTALKRVYLDNAATSWPKPAPVYRAVEQYLRDVGAAVGRSVYDEAVTAQGLVENTRRAIAEWIGAKQSENVVFTLNGTDALNTAIHGALVDGGHVVTTLAEHNSVLRPLAALQEAGRIQISRVSCDATGVVDPAEIRRAMRPTTRLVAMTHASNVTGMIQPAAEVGAIARDRGVLFLLDAAQTAGEIAIDVEQMHIDLLAAPGHKGLLGPLGTGFLYVRPEIADQIPALRQGGTGTHSDRDRQPDAMPDKFEAGNLNVPGIAGLGAGIAWLAERGIEQLRSVAIERTRKLIDGLSEIKGVRLFGARSAEARVAVVSISVSGYDPQELAATLDASFRVQARAGLHCAPLMHRALGTTASGGTLRFSPGPLTTEEEIDVAVRAVAEVAAQSPVV
ncbi:MAG TPA: aminotransferase class V-fold PLP-dependent enzyme [Pirellulales bacterium]|nr:aminotransferase class V-fold PLP-dependent enzyme [Pirellulales bacterium]